MNLAKVVGTATSTVKHPSMQGRKLLLVQLHLADGVTPDGHPLLAVDAIGAGPGDTVMLSSDGEAVRELLGFPKTPVRWLIAGIVDQ